nr:MAG TPA: hypothetical protein [Caudoviricetes sp.]
MGIKKAPKFKNYLSALVISILFYSMQTAPAAAITGAATFHG